MKDTTKPGNLYQEELATYIGKKSLLYKNYGKTLASEHANGLSLAEIKEYHKSAEFNRRYRQVTQEDLIFYPAQKKAYRTNRLLTTDYLWDIDYPQIQWKIYKKEKKKIGGYNCQKATGSFAGREFTAWFTKDLNVEAGPWKLTGLPGAILEASDKSGQVKWEFLHYKALTKTLQDVGPSDITVRVSKERYDAIRNMALKDPQSAMNAAYKKSDEDRRNHKKAFAFERTVVMPVEEDGEQNPIERK